MACALQLTALKYESRKSFHSYFQFHPPSVPRSPKSEGTRAIKSAEPIGGRARGRTKKKKKSVRKLNKVAFYVNITTCDSPRRGEGRGRQRERGGELSLIALLSSPPLSVPNVFPNDGGNNTRSQ